ncbi:MAG: hypothetical protein ACE5KT_05565 [Methanosarcinales archaeon]
MQSKACARVFKWLWKQEKKPLKNLLEEPPENPQELAEKSCRGL